MIWPKVLLPLKVQFLNSNSHGFKNSTTHLSVKILGQNGKTVIYSSKFWKTKILKLIRYVFNVKSQVPKLSKPDLQRLFGPLHLEAPQKSSTIFSPTSWDHPGFSLGVQLAEFLKDLNRNSMDAPRIASPKRCSWIEIHGKQNVSRVKEQMSY